MKYFKTREDFLNESSIIYDSKDVSIIKIDSTEHVEEAWSELFYEGNIENFEDDVYVIKLPTGQQILVMNEDDLFLNKDQRHDELSYSFSKIEDTYLNIRYIGIDKNNKGLREPAILKLLNKYRLGSQINKFYKVTKIDLNKKDIPTIHSGEAMGIYSAAKEYHFWNIGGPNREGEDTEGYLLEGPMQPEIVKYIDKNFNVFTSYRVESDVNVFNEFLSGKNYYDFGSDVMCSTDINIPKAKYKLNLDFGHTHSRKGLFGYTGEPEEGKLLSTPSEVIFKVCEWLKSHYLHEEFSEYVNGGMDKNKIKPFLDILDKFVNDDSSIPTTEILKMLAPISFAAYPEWHEKYKHLYRMENYNIFK